MKKIILSFSLLFMFVAAFSQTTISAGGVHEGKTFTGTVTVNTTAKVTFRGCTFESSAMGVKAHNPGSQLEFFNCKFIGKNPGAGKTQGKIIHLWQPKSLVFHNNEGEGFRGIWFQNPQAGYSLSVKGNYWKNIQGRVSTGAGENSYSILDEDPNPENSQFIMVNATTPGVPEISWNYLVNEAYKSKVEDVINCKPCVGGNIENNLFVGNYNAHPIGSVSYAGTMIQIEGDEGTNTASRNLSIRNNVLVGGSNAPLAISWSIGSTITGNRVVGTGKIQMDDAAKDICQTWKAILIGNPGWPRTVTGNTATGNYTNFPQNFKGAGNCNITSNNYQNQIYFVSNNTVTGNTQKATPATDADEKAEVAAWLRVVRDAGITIGAGGATPGPPVDTVVTPPVVVPPVVPDPCTPDTIKITITKPGTIQYIDREVVVRDTIFVTLPGKEVVKYEALTSAELRALILPAIESIFSGIRITTE